MSINTWRWRTKPRSAIRAVQWFEEFAKLECTNWNETLQSKLSRDNKPIHPVRRLYTYNAHIRDKENEFLTEEQFLSGCYDKNEVEGDARNDKSTFEDYGFGYVDEKGIVRVTKVGQLIVEHKFDSEDFLKQILKINYPNLTYEKDKIGTWNIFPMELVLKVFDEFESINRYELALFFGCTNCKNIPFLIKAISKFKTEYEKLENKSEKAKTLFEKIFKETYGASDNKTDTFLDYAEAFSRTLTYTGLFSSHGRSCATKLRVADHAKLKFDLLVKNYKFELKEFSNLKEYMDWFGNPDTVSLPWDNIDKQKLLIKEKVKILQNIEKGKHSTIKNTVFVKGQIEKQLCTIEEVLKSDSEVEIKNLGKEIENALTTLNEENYINELAFTDYSRKEILDRFDLILKNDDMSALWLEVNTWKSLLSIRGEKNVKRNFAVEEDLTPKSFAPGIGNTPDMELFTGQYIVLPEVSLMTGVRQWEHEGSSVIEHVLRFINENDDKEVFGLFISSVINIRTKWQFFILNKESWIGKPVPVIPLTIKMYIDVLKFIYEKEIKIDGFIKLLVKIHELSKNSATFDLWYDDSTRMIEEWKLKF